MLIESFTFRGLRLLTPIAVITLVGCAAAARRSFTAAQLGECTGRDLLDIESRLRLHRAERLLTRDTDGSVGVLYVFGESNWLKLFIDAHDPALPTMKQYTPSISFEECRSAKVAGLWSLSGDEERFAGDFPFRIRLHFQMKGLLPPDDRFKVIVVPNAPEE